MNNSLMPSSLDDYFKYWDEFFKNWKEIACKQKSEPDREKAWKEKYTPDELHFNYPVDILNSEKEPENKPTFNYIPEPYWGWTPRNGHELKVVVVNYNPGLAENNQHISVIKNEDFDYQKYVKNQIGEYYGDSKADNRMGVRQYKTSNWHEVNRAKPLSDIFTDWQNSHKEPLKYYLGIELVPWHTKGTKDLQKYFTNNKSAIIKWSLNFAFQACKKIESGPFQNTVIFRLSHKSDRTGLLKSLLNLKSKQESNKIHKKDNESYYISSIGGVKIICLTGTRNNLPSIEFINKAVIDKEV